MAKVVARINLREFTRLMLVNGYDNKSLADEIGITDISVSKIRTGRTAMPRRATLKKICEAFGCKPDDLIEVES